MVDLLPGRIDEKRTVVELTTFYWIMYTTSRDFLKFNNRNKFSISFKSTELGLSPVLPLRSLASDKSPKPAHYLG